MAPDNGVFLFNFKSNRNGQGFCNKAAWSLWFSGLLTSGSFNCDEKKVLYFEQKGSSPCTNPGL